MSAKTLQLEKILKGKLFRFFGGIKPKEYKDTTDDVITDLKIPSIICIPVDRHLGKDGELLVSPGDHVKRGQKLTEPTGRLVPVHASTSGTIQSISNEVLPHPSGFRGLCITIKPDGLDESIDPVPMDNWKNASNEELLARIHDFGVEGMGGGLFQTDFKLSSGINDSKDGCKVFIVNACECEPGLTCDDRLMQEQATDIAKGIEIINQILKPKVTVVAIEDNKPKAIKAMLNACKDVASVRVLPTVYPSGSARNLIKIITDLEIPYNAHTSECGVVVNNVATVLAVKEAVIDGIPVTSRVVTATGQRLRNKGNFRVRLGTSVRFILSNAGLNPEFKQRVFMGGPMMGFTLPSIDVPVTKATSCIMAPSTDEMPRLKEATACIRCGRCARVCPSRLVPYQMYAQSMAANHAAAQKCGIKDCTLCGSCAYVCPSFIPLTAQFRYEKAVEVHIRDAERRNLRAKERMAEHQLRLEREEEQRRLKKEAALARMKEQKEAEANMSPEELALARQRAIEEARKKALERKAALLAAKDTKPNSESSENAEVNDEVKTINRLKESERKAIEIAKHKGFIEKEEPKQKVQENVDTPSNPEETDILPDALKIGKYHFYEGFVHFEKPEETQVELKLVGLEPDDLLQNPEQKKKIASVLLSHGEEKKETNVLPEALKKKTLRNRNR